MKLRIKRSLFLVHRWFGVAMCMLFALWFGTGIIMMYVEYPELTEEERLDTLPPLDLAAVAVSVDDAIAVSGLERAVATVALSPIGVRPAYRLRDDAGGLAVVYADDGSRFEGHSPVTALAAVQHSGFAAAGQLATYERTIDVDQWTVSSSWTSTGRYTAWPLATSGAPSSTCRARRARSCGIPIEPSVPGIGSAPRFTGSIRFSSAGTASFGRICHLSVGRRHRLGGHRSRHRRAAAAAAAALPGQGRHAVCRGRQMASRLGAQLPHVLEHVHFQRLDVDVAMGAIRFAELRG